MRKEVTPELVALLVDQVMGFYEIAVDVDGIANDRLVRAAAEIFVDNVVDSRLVKHLTPATTRDTISEQSGT